MKKILLIIVLAVLVLAVSYVKTTFDRKNASAAYGDGIADRTELVQARVQIDSLTEIAQTAGEADQLIDSLEYMSAAEYDSLTCIIEEQKRQLAELNEPKQPEVVLAAAPKKEQAPAKVEKKGPSKTELRHRQILSYYKTRYKDLPGDLSKYEHKIAMSEIRQETAQKFAITLADLKKLRTKNDLKY